MSVTTPISLSLLTDEQRRDHGLCDSHWFHYLSCSSKYIHDGIIPISAIVLPVIDPSLEKLLCDAEKCQNAVLENRLEDLPEGLTKRTPALDPCEAVSEFNLH